MSVKSENVELANETISDDISGNDIEVPAVNQDKLAELKAKLAAKNAEKIPKSDRALKFGVIGIGAGGSAIAVEFFKSPNSYPTLILNTARQDLDLIDIPDTQKIYMDAGIDGAAKQQSTGEEVAEVYRDVISNAVKKQLSNCQAFIVATSTGGGTGSGGCGVVIDILNETGKPVIMLALLPMTSEDASIKSNSVNSMQKFSDMVNDGKIANVVYCDNSKIEQMYADVSYMEFFELANSTFVEPLCDLNRLSALPSKNQAFDSAEFTRLILEGKGCISYSKVSIEYGEDEDPVRIAGEVEKSLKNSLLSTLDIETAQFASLVIVGSKNTWDKIPMTNINYALAIFADSVKGAIAVFKGNYIDDTVEDGVLNVYSIFSGLHMPEKRLEDLRNESSHLADLAKQKEINRVKSLNTTSAGKEKHMSKIDDVKAKIAKSNSTFGKFMTNNTIDRRKK